MPVVPNKDFNLFLNGGDPKKTPSIGMDDLSTSSAGYGNVTVPVPPVIMPQSSGVMDRNMGGISPDFQYGDSPESTQVVNNQVAPPTNIYQNILGSIIKNNQNNGKLINQAVDPVFDYIRQQQANSIYPDLGDTTNADYYPSDGVMTSSTNDPIYGSFNQYATQSLTPYAIYDKRNSALQKAAAASIPDLTGLKSKVPDAYVSYKDDVGEKTLKTTQDYIAEGQKLGYGKHTYEILEKGIGDLGQRYQRDIANINTIASKTKDIGKYVDDIYNEEAKGGFVPKVIHDAVEKFRSGSTDLWSGKGTDLELDKLVGQIQSAPNMMSTIKANAFPQDEFTTMIRDSGLKNIGQNKELTYQEVKQVLKPRADKLAEEIWNSNPLYQQYYTKDQISNMIVESNGQQVKDVYNSINTHIPKEGGDGSGSGDGGGDFRYPVDTISSMVLDPNYSNDGNALIGGQIKKEFQNFSGQVKSVDLNIVGFSRDRNGDFHVEWNNGTNNKVDNWMTQIAIPYARSIGATAKEIQDMVDHASADPEKCKVFGLPYTTSDGHTVKWNGTQWVKI